MRKRKQLCKYKCRACGKHFVLFYCVIGAGALLLLYYWYQLSKMDKLGLYEPRLLLWWTQYDETLYYRDIYCGYYVCTITNDRQRFAEAKVILFYGSHIRAYDMPLPRHGYQLWALLQDETPQNASILFYEEFLHHFNYTSTFSRYSDFPLTLRSLRNAKDLISSTYVRRLRSRFDLPILFMQDNCDTLSGGEHYVRELMKLVPVWSCGACLRNIDAPSFKRENDDLRYMSEFKFVLAFEDAICDDYITDAYWQALIVGAIPIYFGSPTIRDWEPNNPSAIYVSDFQSPTALADFIFQLDGNETAYFQYMQHKLNTAEPITNQRLLKALLWHYNFNISKKFENFEIEMCNEINSSKEKPVAKMANQTHFNCPQPQHLHTTLKNYTKHASKWEAVFTFMQCVARLLDRLLQQNAPYTSMSFTNKLQQLIGWSAC